MERNILLTIEYMGTDFFGWQRQRDKRTVQGELEKALSKACNCPVMIDGTSRTDRGVHGLDQKATFSGEFGIPTDRIPLVVNNLICGEINRYQRIQDVRVISAEEVPLDFHARFNCKAKTYEYVICNSGSVDIFRRNVCYQVTERLDVAAMREASRFLLGRHDFAAFQAAGGTPKETTVRTIFDASVSEEGDDIIFEVTGDGFLYNMVRIIVGTLVEVGLGKKRPAEVEDIVTGCDRTMAGHTAPPEGLYLKKVFFDIDEMKLYTER